MSRHCGTCKKELTRRDNETIQEFIERQYCNRVCSGRHYTLVKKSKGGSDYFRAHNTAKVEARTVLLKWAKGKKSSVRGLQEALKRVRTLTPAHMYIWEYVIPEITNDLHPDIFIGGDIQ